jgi:hypothetical protein
MKMNTLKANKVIYWIATLIFVVPSGIMGILELFLGGPQSTVQALVLLGYPLYLLKIIGFAKIAGAIAVLFNKAPRLKEWAYAGFTIEFLGAAASHFLAGDAKGIPAPLIILIFTMVSYFYWHKNLKAV